MKVRGWREITSLILLGTLLLILLMPTTIKTGDDLAIPESPTIIPVGGLTAGAQARQIFPPSGASIASIHLLLATYQRMNVGIVTISVSAQRYDGRWDTLVRQVVQKDQLQDNALYTITFSPAIPVGKATALAITVQADGPPDQAIAWWANSGEPPPGYRLTFNEQPIRGVARFAVRYERETMPFIRAIPLIWKRITPFLNAKWQLVLFLCAICVTASSVAIIYRATTKVRE